MSEKFSLGISIEKWLGETAEQLVVGTVHSGGFAEVGGIIGGDIIIEIAGLPPAEWLRNAPRTGVVRVVLLRDGAKVMRYLEFPPAPSPEPQPQPDSARPQPGAQPKPASDELPSKAILGSLAVLWSLEQPFADAFNRIIGAIERLKQKLDRKADEIIPGIRAAISGLEKSCQSDDIDATLLDRDLLLKCVCGLDDVAKLIESRVELICNVPQPPADCVGFVEDAGRTVIAYMKFISRLFNAAKPRPEGEGLTRFVGIGERFKERFNPDIPAMTNMPRNPSAAATPARVPHRDEASAPRRTTGEIDREIARKEQLLAKSPPLQHAWINQRLRELRHEKLGIAPPSRPARAQPEPMPGRQYDPHKWRREYGVTCVPTPRRVRCGSRIMMTTATP